MADREKMFFFFFSSQGSKGKEGGSGFLRFLWWPDGELTQEPQEYCMTVHVFGAGNHQDVPTLP